MSLLDTIRETRDVASIREMYEFIHFANANDCDTYLKNNRHIYVSYLCCGGRGYATPARSTPQRILKQSKENVKPYSSGHKVTQGTCDICFLENAELHHTCTCCKQPFCMDCLQKLPAKICPNCRSPLS